MDNALVNIADFEAANQLAAHFDPKALQAKLDQLAQRYCPVVKTLNLTYRWTIMQAEFATDVVFKCQEALQAFYPPLLETLIHAVKPAHIATFLGRKLPGNYQAEMGNRFDIRHLGSCLKHQMEPVSQDVRQIQPHPAHRNYGERCLLFSAVSPGSPAQRPNGNEMGAHAQVHHQFVPAP